MNNQEGLELGNYFDLDGRDDLVGAASRETNCLMRSLSVVLLFVQRPDCGDADALIIRWFACICSLMILA